MVRLSEFRDLGIDLAWHEAVALVLEITDRFVPPGSDTVPMLAGLTLARQGTLRELDLARLGGSPVPRLAEHVRALVGPTGCPPPLDELAGYWTATGDVQGHDVERWRTALAYFERPNRAGVLAELGARAGDASRACGRAEELDELTARAREEAARRPARSPSRPAWRSPRAAVRALLLTVAFAVVAAPAAYLWPRLGAAPGTPSLAPRAVEQVGTTIRSGVAALLGSTSKESPPPSGTAPAIPPANAAVRSARPPAPAGEPTVTAPAAGPSAGRPALSAPGDNATPSPPEAAARAEQADAAVVFDESDPGIEPPSLRRPVLPREPRADTAEDAAGTLDLVIGADGRVEHVQLVSPSNRYHERMLVSVAKAWVFEPARKDGRPVRCRTRIRVVQ